MNRRAQQVASVLHREVQQVLDGGLADPRLDSMITVTKVSVTDDLHESVIHVSVMPEKRESAVFHGLRDAAGYIRREASNRIDLRRTPKLSFKIDRSLKNEASFLGALSEVRNDTNTNADAHMGTSENNTNQADFEEPSD